MTAPVHYKEGAFPPPTLDWPALIPEIGPASAAVARYDGTLSAIPNADVLLSPLTTREAVLSSKIEGTQATMGEVLELEADGSDEKLPEARRQDIFEILNYRAAMRRAEELLGSLPLSLRVVRAAHETLLAGVRGKDKSPGEFRRIPNWIGPPGCAIEEATFVPIGVDKLDAAINRWELYIHEQAPDPLVQLALLHAEFEAIHPFLDGNGRLGRILVPIFLWQHGLIHKPMFYLSAYLEANRDAYYERLLAVSRDGDWTGWCRFFLVGVRQQAEENLEKTQAILALYEDLKPKVAEWTHSQYAIHAQDWIFGRPIFRSTQFIADAQIPKATARRLLNELKENGLLREISPGRGQRAAVLIFPKLLNIAEGQDLF